MMDKQNALLSALKTISPAPCDRCRFHRVCESKQFACGVFVTYATMREDMEESLKRRRFMWKYRPTREKYELVFPAEVDA